MIRIRFIALSTSRMEESTPALRVSREPNFQLISSNSYPLNLLLVRSHQTDIIIAKRLKTRRLKGPSLSSGRDNLVNKMQLQLQKRIIQGLNNVTRARFEPRSCNQCRRESGSFNLSGTLLTLPATSLF